VRCCTLVTVTTESANSPSHSHISKFGIMLLLTGPDIESGLSMNLATKAQSVRRV